MKKFVLALSAFLLGVAGAGPMVEFTVNPAGATVSINGENKGVAAPTLQVPDLKPGETYRVVVSYPGYKPSYQLMKMEANGMTWPVRLVPETGLLLLDSEPTGAEIYDERDVYLGQTPRVIASLKVTEPHTLTVSKQGYQDAKVRVSFDGRRPLVEKVALLINSGTFRVSTVPSGATVRVNGGEFGVSPVTVSGVTRGRAKVEVSLPGYAAVERFVDVAPGENPPVSIDLVAHPASLMLSSKPAGAHFFLEEEPFGASRVEPLGNADPVVREELKPGRYRVRAELKGYATKEVTYDITPGEKKVEMFELENIMGALEVVTVPVGATVYVDGHKRGVSTAANPDAKRSDPLVIEGLLAGDHELRVEKFGYSTVTDRVKITSQETTSYVSRHKAVFMADTRVIFIDGEVPVEGVKLSDTSATGGVLTLRLKDGMTRSIPAHRIERLEPIFHQ